MLLFHCYSSLVMFILKTTYYHWFLQVNSKDMLIQQNWTDTIISCRQVVIDGNYNGDGEGSGGMY